MSVFELRIEFAGSLQEIPASCLLQLDKKLTVRFLDGAYTNLSDSAVGDPYARAVDLLRLMGEFEGIHDHQQRVDNNFLTRNFQRLGIWTDLSTLAMTIAINSVLMLRSSGCCSVPSTTATGYHDHGDDDNGGAYDEHGGGHLGWDLWLTDLLRVLVVMHVVVCTIKTIYYFSDGEPQRTCFPLLFLVPKPVVRRKLCQLHPPPWPQAV